MGAQVLREVAKQTNDVAGDGTTTATVLADALIQRGLDCLTAGANPIDLVHGSTSRWRSAGRAAPRRDAAQERGGDAGGGTDRRE